MWIKISFACVILFFGLTLLVIFIDEDEDVDFPTEEEKKLNNTEEADNE